MTKALPRTAGKRVLAAARRLYQTDDIEIDDNAAVSRSEIDGGTWVAAWVWVHDDEL